MGGWLRACYALFWTFWANLPACKRRRILAGTKNSFYIGVTEDVHRRLAVIGRLERRKAPVHQVTDALFRIGQEKTPHSYVVNQHAVAVYHVNQIERLFVMAVLPNVI
jgi:hypothetical protein